MVWTAIMLMGLATLFGWFPLWKSSTLSPDSIQRRAFWTGMGASVPLIFIALLPDLRGALFVATISVLVIVSVALRWTRHVKVRGTVYSADPDRRRPDRPPALSDKARD
jgi:hypothetical protein